MEGRRPFRCTIVLPPLTPSEQTKAAARHRSRKRVQPIYGFHNVGAKPCMIARFRQTGDRVWLESSWVGKAYVHSRSRSPPFPGPILLSRFLFPPF